MSHSIWVRSKEGWVKLETLRPGDDVDEALKHYRLHYPNFYYTAAVKRPTTFY